MSEKSPVGPPSPEVTQAWINLMRAQQRVLGAIERDFKAAGLPGLGWYDVLWELSRADGGRLRPFEIEERTLLAQYNLSRLIDRLEREALVERQTFDEDARGRWVVITEKGRALRIAMWDVYGRAIARHVGSKLTETDAVQLAKLLSQLT
ncbi:MarR family winged helix-turn-helix transcriptional regulator [Pararhizobium sp. BT-229]|uniref:MarR family winged helix-turn-helix transcriptional regulator n=1 Tax=Pararhizobium sp. BT-229 TaxID=2986923 RepID=UPI0021F7545F|nr:MarR family winged helix-turn-helix transcriptional regulator [Pararhizobium sp. BT-229]MCV9962393.1 MarR family winged helix-turn-helix transcriptional regulator [Pararhizobium sp. BT-229]